jgi:hypothetical protein
MLSPSSSLLAIALAFDLAFHLAPRLPRSPLFCIRRVVFASSSLYVATLGIFHPKQVIVPHAPPRLCIERFGIFSLSPWLVFLFILTSQPMDRVSTPPTFF